MTSEKFIERQNLNKKIDFDAITAKEKLDSVVNGNKSWQGSTYDNKKKTLNDRSNFTKDKPSGVFSDEKAVNTSSHSTANGKEKELADSLKVEIPSRPKAEFIRTPEGDVKYYENKWYSEVSFLFDLILLHFYHHSEI